MPISWWPCRQRGECWKCKTPNLFLTRYSWAALATGVGGFWAIMQSRPTCLLAPFIMAVFSGLLLTWGLCLALTWSCPPPAESCERGGGSHLASSELDLQWCQPREERKLNISIPRLPYPSGAWLSLKIRRTLAHGWVPNPVLLELAVVAFEVLLTPSSSCAQPSAFYKTACGQQKNHFKQVTMNCKLKFCFYGFKM